MMTVQLKPVMMMKAVYTLLLTVMMGTLVLLITVMVPMDVIGPLMNVQNRMHVIL
jgi:hypothetical protein